MNESVKNNGRVSPFMGDGISRDSDAGAPAHRVCKESKRSKYSLLTGLIHQKDRYDAYFDSLPPGEVDNRAIQAYTGILKRILDFYKEMNGRLPESFSGFYRELLSFLEEKDVKAAEIFLNHFDAFAEHIREKFIAGQ